MNQTTGRTIAAAGLALAALLVCLPWLLPGSAVAAVTLEEHFDVFDTAANPGSLVDTSRGKGWRAAVRDDHPTGVYLKYPAAEVMNAAEGTIELEFIRGNQEKWENLFSLVDGAGGVLLYCNLTWDGGVLGDLPEIRCAGTKGRHGTWYSLKPTILSRGKKGPDMEVNAVSFGSAVPQGARLHLAFTWGKNPQQNAIYLNGRKLKAKAASPFGLPALIGNAASIVFGAEPDRGKPGAMAHLYSTLEYVRVYDEPIAGSRLYTADRYVPTGPGALAIASLDHDASRVAGFSGTLVAGDTVQVTMTGTPGAPARFDVLPLTNRAGEIPLDWKGWGVYLEDKTFFDEGEINLRDVEEYRVYASRTPLPLGTITVDTPYVEALEVEEQSYLLEGLDSEAPYYAAVLALLRDDTLVPVIRPAQSRALTEDEIVPGTYAGSFTMPYGEQRERVVVVGRLGSGEHEATLTGDEEFAVDSRLNVAVETTPQELKADEQSTAEVTVTVTDANGDAVPDHEIRFLLATTSTYTGVVGGGAFAEETGGAIELNRRFRSTTDLFGRVKATYTAGFAAKTAIIVARDMKSNDTGAGYITTYIEATADIVLEEELTVARSKALAGYKMTVTSSDEWLTADGESEARITAMVTLQGQPVAGHRVGFTVTSGTGRIRTVSGTTDGSGKARAVYTAGTKIGMVVIQAVDHTIRLSGTVEIELRSDAPAKIAITVSPEVLFADGRSTSDIEVTVTDINDNPNEGVLVEYGIVIGSGDLRRIDDVTDRNGISTAEYVAGRIPGRVSIGVTVRSTAPTEEELLAMRDLALAVLDYDFY